MMLTRLSRFGLKPIVLATVVLLLSQPLPAQEENNPDTGPVAPAAEAAPPAAPAERPLVELWRDILQFGLDSEVTELLTTLTEQREQRLHPELVELFETSINPRLKQRILEFFTTMKYQEAEPLARSILIEYREVPTDLTLASIRYVMTVIERPDDETRAALLEIANGNQLTLAETAIRAIGQRGTDDDIPMLLDRLTDRRSANALRASTILALGELKADSAVDELIRIATDTSEEITLRQFSADSLGKIGDRRAVPVLTDLAGGSDTMLRAYAVNALGFFDGPESARIVTNALRDSFWRVRIAALQAAARHDIAAAIPSIIFRAERDPEQRVRTEAFTSLAAMSDRRAATFLEEYVMGDRNPEAMRIVALQQLLRNDLPGNLSLVEQLIDLEYGKAQSRILDQVGQIVSTSDESLPTRIYERFLDHQNFILQIYGVRSAGRHGVGSLKARVSTMTEAPYHPAVRRAAVDALDRM